MAYEKLGKDDQEIILECMSAILKSPYIEDSEFRARLGIDRGELVEVISAYPNLRDEIDDSITTLAINNCLNEVSHGLSIPPSEWGKWFSTSKDNVRRVYTKWTQLKGYSSTGIT